MTATPRMVVESPGDPAEVLTRIQQSGVALIDLLFSDISGGTKVLTIPAALLPRTMQMGCRFDGSALTGGIRQMELDLYLVPDARTLVILPPTENQGARARICCSVVRRDQSPFDGDPRSVLERAVTMAREAGFDYRVGIEMEFYLIKGNWSEISTSGDAAGYFDVGVDLQSAARDELMSTLQSMGIGIGGAHHETGPGQEELDMLAVPALQMADQLMSVRQVIRSVALRHDLRATFMPKPFADAPGSGLHLFQFMRSAASGDDALKGEGDGLSRLGHQMIAGQLMHAPGMSIVHNPTVNSYKRLNAGHRAPRYATWAHMSQSSLIRVPAWAPGEDAALELRSPDSLSNPYLTLAVALHCAMDGVRSNDEPPEPLEEGLGSYDDAGMHRMGIPRLPGTLGEALTAVTQDAVVQGALGPYIYDQLMTVKQAEWEDYRAHVSPWEHRRYGDA